MLGVTGQQLTIDGRSVEALADELGTPCFVLSSRRLRDNYHAIENGLSDGLAGAGEASIRYCAKTNSDARVLSVLAECGSDVLVSHAAEAERALAAGFLGEQLSYQRPVLERREIERALALGARRFHVYREHDVELLSDSAARQAIDRVEVVVRLAARNRARRLSPLGLVAGRLGVEPEQALACARLIARDSRLVLAGLSFHAGTQAQNVAAYQPMLRVLSALAARIEREHGLRLSEVNLGGGLPSPTLQKLSPLERCLPIGSRLPDGDEPLALRAFARELARLAKVSLASEGVHHAKIVVEPGRAIVSNAAVMLTRVSAVEGRWLYLDTTRNYLPESSLVFSRALLPARLGCARTRVAHLSGSTLNSMDVLDLMRRVPEDVRAGDVLVLCDAGAYSLARATSYACEPPRMFVLEPRDALRSMSTQARSPVDEKASAIG